MTVAPPHALYLWGGAFQSTLVAHLLLCYVQAGWLGCLEVGASSHTGDHEASLSPTVQCLGLGGSAHIIASPVLPCPFLWPLHVLLPRSPHHSSLGPFDPLLLSLPPFFFTPCPCAAPSLACAARWRKPAWPVAPTRHPMPTVSCWTPLPAPRTHHPASGGSSCAAAWKLPPHLPHTPSLCRTACPGMQSSLVFLQQCALSGKRW